MLAVLAVAFSESKQWLATGDCMSKAKVWDTATGEVVQTIDCGGWVYSVSFVAETLLATGDQGKVASLWDLSSGDILYRLECQGEVRGIAISHDLTSLLAGDTSGAAHLWYLANVRPPPDPNPPATRRETSRVIAPPAPSPDADVKGHVSRDCAP